MKNKKGLLILAVIAIIVVIVSVFILLPRLKPPAFHGMLLQGTSPVFDFDLTSDTDESVKLSDFRGKPVLLYFGYTFCPDVCPTTMAELGRMMRELGDDADDVQVIMISIDPERDTPERLGEYVRYFHPSFIGLTGTEDEIAQAATPLGIFYAKQEVEGASGYLMDHTATVLLVDKDGLARLIWPYGTSAEDMAADVRYFLP
ncbi:MAG TPA: SCO family protein [Caldilineae bacterium]|nr:SCO family protein [Caldilineae bacterium]